MVKFTVIGTMLAAVGVLIGIASLKPEWFGLGASAKSADPVAQAAPAAPKSTASDESQVSSPSDAMTPSGSQTVHGNNNTTFGYIGTARDVIVNPKPTEPAYVVLKSYWLSKEPTLLLTYSPRSERSADVIKGTEVRVLRREKGTFYAFGKDNSIDLFYVEIVSGFDKGIKGYIPENMLELKQ
jgi:hypothetical protein